MSKDVYIKGLWNVLCDDCGTKYKSNQVRKDWQGLYLCDGADTNQCWNPRHPQDHVRGKRDNQRVPFVRPQGEIVYLETNEIKREDY